MSNKKKMNLPNKLTILRIFLAVIIMLLFVLPWSQLNVEWKIIQFKNILIDLRYIVAGVIFIIASITDFLDGYIAREQGLVTNFGKTMDAVADKILVNGLLIILAYERHIPLIIPVVIISRDIFTDSLKSIVGSNGKVVAASNLGKIKTTFMMLGLILVLFYNLPFELFNLDVASLFILIATILSVASAIEYYYKSKEHLFK